MGKKLEDVLAILDDAKAKISALSDEPSDNPDVEALKAQIAELEKKNSDQASALSDAVSAKDAAVAAAQSASDELSQMASKEADEAAQLASAKEAMAKADSILKSVLEPQAPTA